MTYLPIIALITDEYNFNGEAWMNPHASITLNKASQTVWGTTNAPQSLKSQWY